MIGRLLGHSKVGTTARYANLVHDAEKAAAARTGASRRCQGCFHLRRRPPGQVAPKLNRPASTDRWRWPLPTARFESPSLRSVSA